MRLHVSDHRGGYRPATPAEIIEAAQAHALRELNKRGPALTRSKDAADLLFGLLGTREHEAFAALYLDARHRVIATRVEFHGTIDGASVHTRVIVARALHLGAAAVIVAHNHPSGTCEPSQADMAITRRLRDALALVDVRLLDHIIVAAGGTYSFADAGKL